MCLQQRLKHLKAKPCFFTLGLLFTLTHWGWNKIDNICRHHSDVHFLEITYNMVQTWQKFISKSTCCTNPQCTSLTSHNVPFCSRNVHMYAHFCYKMVHCGIFVKCIVGLARGFHWSALVQTMAWHLAGKTPLYESTSLFLLIQYLLIYAWKWLIHSAKIDGK